MPLPAGTVSESGAKFQSRGRERRRTVRHKLPHHAGVRVDFPSSHSPRSGEIADLSEEGIGLRNLPDLAKDEKISLSFDLSPGRGTLEVLGRVIWSDSGCSGLQFVDVQPEQRMRVRESLSRVATNQIGDLSQSTAAEAVPDDYPALEPPLIPEYTALLAAVEAVRREVQALHPDVDAALQLVAERARSLTQATGAAIALSGGEDLICRATSGSGAPSLGALLQAGSGFSGECIRTGELLYCRDSDHDPRVHRENSSALGVRSMVAAPIRSGAIVIGLLEAFSPQADIFTESDKVVLQRLAEIVGDTVDRAAQPTEVLAMAEDELVQPEIATHRSLLLRIVGATTAAAAVVGLLFFLVPRLQKRPPPPAQHPAALQSAVSVPSHETGPSADTLEGLQRLAEQGDATAQFDVGVRYALGDGVRQDYAESARWFTMAAEQGHVAAESSLGAYYWSGTGVPKDLSKAYFWTVLAQAGGDEPSKLRLSTLASHMTRQEMLAAQEEYSDWIRQHPSSGKLREDQQ